MKEWYSIPELLALEVSGLPGNLKSLREFAKDHNWDSDKNRCRERDGKGGGTTYHYELLPISAKADITYREAMAEIKANEEPSLAALKKEALWECFQNAPQSCKDRAQKYCAIVQQVGDLLDSCQVMAAVQLVSNRTGVPIRTINRYREKIASHPRCDWLAVLLPAYKGGGTPVKFDDRIWDHIVALYMRPEQPSWKVCFDFTDVTAAAEGWGKVPSAKTLKRRLEKEFTPEQIILARQGRAALERLYPSQTRDHSVFHAMEAVNADGHIWDVFVKWEDGTIGRPVIVGFQDVYSALILSHRISQTENSELVRLALADMVESWGIPEHCYFDNGRAFMNKCLTGRMKFRFRFKVRDEDPEGILTNLGVKVHPTTPYHGQAKPIERAWKDMCDRIAKHPKFAGAYVGNNPMAKPENYRSKSIPIEEFRKIVAEEILRHNTRTGRRSKVANGRSFAEVFSDSLEQPTTLIRKATEMQRQFFLMAGEAKQALKKNGEIHLAENRYWTPDLIGYRGKKLIIRFDPENLHEDLHVYTMDGRYITKAPCIEMSGYNTTEHAKRDGLLKRRFLKATREALDLGRRLKISEAARLIPSPEPMEMPETTVVGMIHGNRALKPQPQSNPDEDAAAFARGLTQIYPRSDE